MLESFLAEQSPGCARTTLQTPDLLEAAHQEEKKLGNRNDFQPLLSCCPGAPERGSDVGAGGGKASLSF
jgi:hypothetical protein